jgi:N utilization substance protein B
LSQGDRRRNKPSQLSQVRRQGRQRALQFLYGLDFTRYDWREHEENFWATATDAEDEAATADPPAAREYGKSLIAGVMEHLEEIDAAFVGALERWSPQRVGAIERNIVRIALYEMRWREDVPDAVAINEAIELSKHFGSDEAPRFVNGILDRLREPPPTTNGNPT